MGEALAPLVGDKAEFGEMGPQCVAQLRALTDQQSTRAMDGQRRLLLVRLDGHEAHARPRHGFADRCGVGCSVLLAADIGLDVARRDQPDLVPKLTDLASPVMGRRAGLHADLARAELGEERGNLAATQLPRQHDLAVYVDAVNPEYVLGDIVHPIKGGSEPRSIDVRSASNLDGSRRGRRDRPETDRPIALQRNAGQGHKPPFAMRCTVRRNTMTCCERGFLSLKGPRLCERRRRCQQYGQSRWSGTPRNPVHLARATVAAKM